MIPYLLAICGGCFMYLGDRVQASHKHKLVHYPAVFTEAAGCCAVIYSMTFFH